MPHVDPDRLAFLALGEPPADAEERMLASHFLECSVCRDEVVVLRQVIEMARTTAPHAFAARPPEAVWTRITTELGVTDPPAPLGAGRRHRAREPRPWSRVGALVAAVAVGVVGTLGTVRAWPADPVPPAASTAVLAAVAGGPAGATGRAVVVRTATGAELRITVAGLPLQRGYYEVWVYDGERRMVSVGVLGAGSAAVLPLPPTLDLNTFHVVDVSPEQYDGNQQHSGSSVLRGTLTG